MMFGIHNLHRKKVPFACTILFPDVLSFPDIMNFFYFRDWFLKIECYLKCNMVSHWLQSLWDVFR